MPGYPELEELVLEAQRLSSTALPEVATLCERIRTDLLSLEQEACDEIVGITQLFLDLLRHFSGFAQRVSGWMNRGMATAGHDENHPEPEGGSQ